MFKTFKGRIETEVESDLVNKGDAFLFNPSNPHMERFIKIDIRNEVFEFSKENIIFSSQQKVKYKNQLQLHPVYGVGDTFSDGIKYVLHRRHEKGKTKYKIEVDGMKAELHLNWWNRQKIEWVHDRKINWAAWQGVGAIAVVILMVLVFFVPTKTKDVSDDTPSTTQGITQIDSANGARQGFADTTKKNDSIKTSSIKTADTAK